MNLEIIKDFFTCIGNVEELRTQKISAFRFMFPRINFFSLFKQLSSSSTAHINSIHMKKYMSQFSSNLQIIDPNEINSLTSSKNFAATKKISHDEILEKGIELFLTQWGNSQKEFTYTEFSKFFTNEETSPEQPQEVPYHARKKLFEIIEAEIQGLLNIETLRQVCFKEYKNLPDLFETIANKETHQISTKSLKNLYLMHGQRMTEEFYEKIEKRLKLPMSFEQFMRLIKKNQLEKNPKLQERKVYYSSIRRKKDIDQQQEEGDYFDEYSQRNYDEDKVSKLSNSRRSIQFQTPKTQKANIENRGLTSTKLTKGEKITTLLKQPSVTVGRFKSHQETPERFYSTSGKKASVVKEEIEILGEILNYEEQFIKLKRNLCLRRDMDLELAYERVGERFSELLNELYGCCNFTSFVRFIVPKDFEYKYLAFVRHEVSNKLSEETLMLFEELLEAYERKEYHIRELWSKVDREMMFRMYCNPGEEEISVEELGKYFSERESKMLIERMDPLGTGMIEFEMFR